MMAAAPVQYTYEEVAGIVRDRIAGGEALLDEVVNQFDRTETKRRMRRWECDYQDEVRQYDHAWLTQLGHVNEAEMIDPTDSGAMRDHLQDRLSRLRRLVGD
jgi:hypothetical protein